MEPGLRLCARTKSRVFSTTYMRLGLLPFIQNLRRAWNQGIKHTKSGRVRCDMKGHRLSSHDGPFKGIKPRLLALHMKPLEVLYF
jgi:hypothetical protein